MYLENLCMNLQVKVCNLFSRYDSQANLRRAYGQFSEDFLEGCSKQAEFRAISFGLAYFHAAMLERKRFGVGNLPGATSGMLRTACTQRASHRCLIS